MAAIQWTTVALIGETQGIGGFTSAEGEIQLEREQTQMLGCLLCQNTFQRNRQKETEIHYIYADVFCCMLKACFYMYNLYLFHTDRTISVSIFVSFSPPPYLQWVSQYKRIPITQQSQLWGKHPPPNTMLTDCFPHQQRWSLKAPPLILSDVTQLWKH